MPKFTFVLGFLVLAFGASAHSGEAPHVSLIQLIANPQQFDGKPIRVLAYLHLEYEGDALYLHREDFDKKLWTNAVSISLEDAQLRHAKKLSGGFVVVEGVYSAKDRGHFGMFSGSIGQVSVIKSYERRRK